MLNLASSPFSAGPTAPSSRGLYLDGGGAAAHIQPVITQIRNTPATLFSVIISTDQTASRPFLRYYALVELFFLFKTFSKGPNYVGQRL